MNTKLFWIRTSGLVFGAMLMLSISLMTFVLSVHADDASSTPVDTTATVTTGDATAGTDVSNTSNTTDATAPDSTAATSVATDNTATVDTSASSSAETGGNSVISDADSTSTPSVGVASVSTGSAMASANVLNVVNTTVVNSSGLVAFLNYIFGGDIDLRSLGLDSIFDNSADSSCSLSACGGTLSVTSSSTASVTNDVVVRAQTGGNTASSTGDASVASGDAYASANVFNVVNSTIADSHYLLLSLNNFGSLGGDIVLPNAAFFEKLMQAGGAGASSVSTANTATVNSNIDVAADTGGNTASSVSGGASVHSGEAVANANSVTQANMTGVGGSNILFLVNVVGNWSGSVRGLPQGIGWTRTPTGIALTSESGDFSAISSPSSASVSTNNTAAVANNVHVYALTGDNHASANGGASVSSGGAYASANVANLVNNTVLGQNWIFAILNVFGDWGGNLTFGRPDLWVGASAVTGNPALSGETIPYRFTVANRGDLDAQHVVLKVAYAPGLLSFDGATSEDAGDAEWDLGDIKAGQSEDFTYYARAGSVASGLTDVPLTATISSDDNDNNTVDNTDHIAVMIGGPEYWRGAGAGAAQPDPAITLIKTASAATTTASSTVDYSVQVSNGGGTAFRTTLTDRLIGPDGKEVSEHSWDLSDINPGDEVTVKYSIGYGADAMPGMYTNVSTLTGQRGNSAWQYAYNMSPVTATSTTRLTPGMVLGAETDVPLLPSCLPLITHYLKPGAQNDPQQVHLLQYYLATFEGIKVKDTHVYDAQTLAAVKAFQKKYAADILKPWHTSTPSGLVLTMTQMEINNHYCANR